MRSRWVFAICNSANSTIRPIPTGSAAARQLLEISKAGVVMKLSS